MEKDMKQDNDFVETVHDNDSVIKIGIKAHKEKTFDKAQTPNRGT